MAVSTVPDYELDNGLDFFTEIFIRYAEHSHVDYFRMACEDIFSLLGIDVDTPGNDHKRFSVTQIEKAVLIQMTNIPQGAPAFCVFGLLGFNRVVVIFET